MSVTIMKELMQDKRKFLTMVGIALLVLVVPLIVIIAQKQQEIRQRASGEDTSVYMTDTDSPKDSITFAPGTAKNVNLYLDTNGNAVTGFDFTINLGEDFFQKFSASDIQEGAGAAQFNTEVFKTFNQSTGVIRFTKVTTSTDSAITGKLLLATISVSPNGNTGTGTIAITRGTVTSITSGNVATSLSVAKLSTDYSVGDEVVSTTPTQEQDTAVFITNLGATPPTENPSINITNLTQQALNLYVDTKGHTITGFDITVDVSGAQNNLTISAPTDGADASKFSTDIFHSYNEQTGKIRYTRVTTGSTPISGILHLATIAVNARQAGNGTISIPTATITSLSQSNQSQSLTSRKFSTNYTVLFGDPPPSPTPTTIQPTITSSVPSCSANQDCPIGQYCAMTNGSSTGTCTVVPTAGPSPISCETSADCPEGTYCTVGREGVPGGYCIGGSPTPSTIITSVPPTFTPTPTDCSNGGCVALAYAMVLPGATQATKDTVIDILDSEGDLVVSLASTALKDQGSTTYAGSVKVPVSVLKNGNYTAKIKANNYLKKKFVNIITVAGPTTIQLPKITLYVGDINSDNSISLLDYNILVDCLDSDHIIIDPQARFNTPRCQGHSAQERENANLNGDNAVNLFDLAILRDNLSFHDGD